jgi:hypothetical protein
MTAGTFHGDEVSTMPGEEWYVLYSKEKRVFLEKASIDVEIVEDVILDEHGEKTGREVSVDIEGHPILLLNNFSNLTPGEILSSVADRIYFFEDDSIKAQLHNTEYLVGIKIYDSKADLFISNGVKKQLLKEFTINKVKNSPYMFGDDAMPSLIWAGDLDRDNKLDLLLEISEHYNVSEITLFLSSHASNGELIKKVAVFRTVGC